MGSPIGRLVVSAFALALASHAAACLSDDVENEASTPTPRGDPAPADVVVDAPAHDADAAMLAINGVRGAGDLAGSEDVLRLGYTDGVDNAVVLRWSDRRVLNGPGVDLVVFENAFRIAGGEGHFMDPAVLELSEDGVTWVPFPHDYVAPDELVYSDRPAHWVGFAGLRPVRLHEEEKPVDPFDSEAAGGDGFDLDDLPIDGGAAQSIRDNGFVFLRIATAPTRLNPDTGEPYPRDPVATGADIDGVYARWFEEE